MTKLHFIAIISLTTVIFTVNAIPQSQQNNFGDTVQNVSDDELIAGIFDPTVRPTPPRRAGPGAVVTGQPVFTPTTSPQTLNIDDQTCTCVSYHLCDPRTNMYKGEDADDDVTGWGKIDIRFDAHDCQAVLDVCCLGVPNVPNLPPPTTPPPKPPTAGCGVRNVGGLDFEVTGAFVSRINFQFVSTHEPPIYDDFS